MYRVRFIIQRPGYRKRYLSGIYIPRQEGMPVAEMKRECEKELLSNLEKQNPEYREFDIRITCFSYLKTDFFYDSRIDK